MVTSKHKRGALKAARLYLEMRGHSLLEQGWSRGRHKIDLIASKNGTQEFIGISYAPEGGISDVTETARDNEKLKLASEAWLEENKYRGTYKLYIVEIYGEHYAVLSFNEL